MTIITMIRATLHPNAAAIVMPTLLFLAPLSVLSALFASVTLSVTFSLLVLSVALSGFILWDDVSSGVLVITAVIGSLLLVVALMGSQVVIYPE